MFTSPFSFRTLVLCNSMQGLHMIPQFLESHMFVDHVHLEDLVFLMYLPILGFIFFLPSLPPWGFSELRVKGFDRKTSFLDMNIPRSLTLCISGYRSLYLFPSAVGESFSGDG